MNRCKRRNIGVVPVPGNLKENSIEQKLIAMQNRMAAGEESESGPDQMLEEACQLAVQLQQLSNLDCNAAKLTWWLS